MSESDLPYIDMMYPFQYTAYETGFNALCAEDSSGEIALANPADIVNDLYTPTDQAQLPQLNFKSLDLENIRACVAYDIGSGSTKIKGALVDIKTSTIEAVFAEYQFPMAYSVDLSNSTSNEFSDLIMEMGITELHNHKKLVEDDFSQLNLDLALNHVGVATAAFRKAENGELFAKHIQDTLDINVSIISQDEEAELSYYGALHAHQSNCTSDDMSDIIVWDIGGGSMQITYQDTGNDFHILKSDTASVGFHDLFKAQVKKADPLTASPNPISLYELEQGVQLAEQSLEFSKEGTYKVQDKLNQGQTVLGVGSVHQFAVQKTINTIFEINSNLYTKDQVYQAASFLSGMTDHQIIQSLNMKDASFAKTTVTNLILTYGLMQKFNIDLVRTVNVNNTDGLLLSMSVDPIQTEYKIH